MAQPLTVTLYTRPGCHLCDDAAAMLRALASEMELRVDTVNINEDPAVYRRFWADIPVVAVGDTLLRAPLEFDIVRDAVARAMPGDR